MFSKLNIQADDNYVHDWVLSYSGSIGIRLRIFDLIKIKRNLFRFFQPFCELTYQHFNTLNDWKVDYKADGKDERMKIPNEYLPYPSLKIAGFSLCFGLVLIGFGR